MFIPVVIHSSVDPATDVEFEAHAFDGDDEMALVTTEDGRQQWTWLSRRQADSLYKAIAHELGDI